MITCLDIADILNNKIPELFFDGPVQLLKDK
jgi:hypothetical protein